MIHIYVTSRLDNGNCLLDGISDHLLTKLQRVQNAAARLITKKTKKHDHITAVLIDLHWLPIKQPIEYKLLLLTFRSLHGLAASYITDLLIPYEPPDVSCCVCCSQQPSSIIWRDLDMEFHAIFVAATDKTQQLNIEPLTLPRQRKIPRRYDDGDEPHTHTSAEQFFRVQFLAAVDSILANIDAFFTSTDLTSYKVLSDMLTSGVVDEDVVSRYPELSESLRQELTFFCRQYEHSSVDKVRLSFRDMVPEVRKICPQVSTLLRLLLVSPASSCSAERAFSAHRRMKPWLRSTMTQQRLNHVMVCHVHRTRLAECSPRDIAAEFVDRSSDTRRVYLDGFKTPSTIVEAMPSAMPLL